MPLTIDGLDYTLVLLVYMKLQNPLHSAVPSFICTAYTSLTYCSEKAYKVFTELQFGREQNIQ